MHSYFYSEEFLKLMQLILRSKAINSIYDSHQLAPEYIDPSGYFVFYEIFCSWNF